MLSFKAWLKQRPSPCDSKKPMKPEKPEKPNKNLQTID